MRLTRLELIGFRSYRRESVVLNDGLTLLAGENGSGKSTIGLAVERLVSGLCAANDPFNSTDLHYGHVGHIEIVGDFELGNEGVERLFSNEVSRRSADATEAETWLAWLQNAGTRFRVSVANGAREHPRLEWGPLRIEAVGRITLRSDAVGPPARLHELLLNFAGDIPKAIGEACRERFAMVPEFRMRSQRAPSSALSSWRGNETAGALFNLRNHQDVSQRERYNKI